MQAEIIPPGQNGPRPRPPAWRRRLMVWCAIIVGIAVAAGILALGFIVLAVAAAIGLVSWILFAVLRRFDGRFGGRRDDRRPDIEIITVRGETLDGGDLGVVADDDRRSPDR